MQVLLTHTYANEGVFSSAIFLQSLILLYTVCKCLMHQLLELHALCVSFMFELFYSLIKTFKIAAGQMS